MSDQSTSTSNTPAEPQLCKMGCGFFGSSATGNCCSKCFLDAQKKANSSAEDKVSVPTPMEVESPTCQEVTSEEAKPVAAPAPASPEDEKMEVAPVVKKVVKKKKKKTSYKNMMASMTQRSSSEADNIKTQKENLRKVTGGGAFAKIDKI
jgi:hypothetical protein